jgi:thiol-disulfide isomerase/thioredoxin
VSLSNAFAYGLPVVVNFWAPLCPPCRTEMPAFQRVADDFAGQVVIVGIDVSPYFTGFGGQAEATQLIQETGVHYPVAYAVDSPLKDYGLKSIPTTVFFTPDGKIAKSIGGDLSESDLRNNVTVLIALGAIAPAQGDTPPGGKFPHPVVTARKALLPRADGRP